MAKAAGHSGSANRTRMEKKKKKDLNGFYDIVSTRGCSDNEAVTL
jgi:hypothetical protein